MERTRKLFAICVIGGFVVLALMPFIGIHPVSLARQAFTSLTESEMVETENTGSTSITFLLANLEDDDPELVKAAIYALSNSLDDDEISMLFPIVSGDYHIEV
jgi:hypothetical protein